MECLPFPSKINSLDWSSFPELAEGVGEVYGSPRPYNGAKAIPYSHGLTPCKPAEVFHDGEHYDPTAPPQKYDELGFPLCCLDRFTSTGGLLWGGTALVNVVPGNTTCPTALPFPMATTIGGVCPEGEERWYVVSPPSVGSYRGTVTLSGAADFGAYVEWRVAVCGNSPWFDFFPPGASVVDTFRLAPGFLFYFFGVHAPLGFGDRTFTIRVDPFPP